MQTDFFKYQAQTTQFAAGFEVEKASGSYIYGKDGRKYPHADGSGGAQSFGNTTAAQAVNADTAGIGCRTARCPYRYELQ